NLDREIDDLFRERIKARFPDHQYHSEESICPDRNGELPCWVIDPLDGTANYVHGLDHVAVSAALAIGGEFRLGVVHAPFFGQTFWAVKGSGAFRDGVRIHVSSLGEPARALIATGFPHDRTHCDELV